MRQIHRHHGVVFPVALDADDHVGFVFELSPFDSAVLVGLRDNHEGELTKRELRCPNCKISPERVCAPIVDHLRAVTVARQVNQGLMESSTSSTRSFPNWTALSHPINCVVWLERKIGSHELHVLADDFGD